MKKQETETVNALKAQINKLQSQIYVIENGILEKYMPILFEEIRNFFAGVGEGYRNGDYYASNRYYSKIPFIKNIRWGYDNEIIVKIISPRGELLPSEITIDDEKYKIVLNYSKYYENEIDY